MDNTIFNERLKLAMERRGMEIAELSALSGVSKDTLRSWRNKRYLPGGVYSLIQVADALHVSIDWLLGRTRKKNGSDRQAKGD